jgi:hypothetical protein
MRSPDRLLIGIAQQPRELAAPRLVNALQEPIVTERGQDERFVIWQGARSRADKDTHRQVLIDDEHCSARPGGRSGVVGVVATEQGIVHEIGVQRGLELVHEVTGRQAQQEFSSFGCHPGVAGASAAAAFLEEFLADTHPPIVPREDA